MPESFTIEKVKWSWPEAVKAKEVYRDEEFIRTTNKRAALQAIEYLLGRPLGNTYTITVRQDGEYRTYFRHSMPCLGGLVKYKDTHGPKYFMNHYFPRDIKVSFPEGDIIYIGIYNKHLDINQPYPKFLFSEESPWISAFGSKKSVLFKKGKGFICTNMNTDPTVLYHFLRHSDFASGKNAAYADWDPKARLLVSMMTRADARRLAGQKPIRISGGTWAEGYGYTRPYNEAIFRTNIPHALEKFGEVSFGSTVYDKCKQEFLEDMKTVFGAVLLPSDDPYANVSKKFEGVLVESWEYFKKKASELSDIPGIKEGENKTTKK